MKITHIRLTGDNRAPLPSECESERRAPQRPWRLAAQRSTLLWLSIATGCAWPSTAAALDFARCGWLDCIGCYCCDDYCRKPLPCSCAVAACCCDDYCRKPLPKSCPVAACCCDDYCRKCLPPICGRPSSHLKCGPPPCVGNYVGSAHRLSTPHKVNEGANEVEMLANPLRTEKMQR